MRLLLLSCWWVSFLLLFDPRCCEGLSKFVPRAPYSLRALRIPSQKRTPIPIHNRQSMFTKTEFLAQTPFILLYWLVFGPLNALMKTLFRRNAEQEWLSAALYSDIKGSHCIVTGSNTGIGFETALELAMRGGSVVLACRSQEKGEEAAKRINALCKARGVGGRAQWMALDLSKLNSVITFCDNYKQQIGSLDIVVNNAGVNTKGTTYDGLNESFQINYLGHYILTRKLLPLLTWKSSINKHYRRQSRVINLSSVMHHTGGVEFAACAYGNGATSGYDDSKLYMNLMTMELNKRYGMIGADNDNNNNNNDHTKRSVLAVSVNPGNSNFFFL